MGGAVIDLIIVALNSGSLASYKDTASVVIQESYKDLKALILRRLSANREAEMILEKYEQKPEVWRYPLEDELMEANADKDETIVQAAQRLLELLNPQQSAQGKYNVQVGSGQGIVIGDSSSIHQHFYDPPPGGMCQN